MSDPASQPPRCPKCGSVIADPEHAGICARCAGRLALATETVASPGEATQTGWIFGDYAIQSNLGSGAMGVTHRAIQLSLGRAVALKLPHTGPFTADEERHRFLISSELAAQLDHPHIVPLYDFGEVEGQQYCAMKLIEGPTLAEWIATPVMAQARTPRFVARLVAQLARAVHHAHQRGVLHRDLKPSNILLDAAREPYVTDFGLARRLDAAATMTATGVAMGTPAYMAPELIRGERPITTAVDIWSLGVILYELLAGRRPFAGESVAELWQRALETEPPSLGRDVDRDLATIAFKCLRKQPGDRYVSAAALAEDLDHWLNAEPITARRVHPAERLWLWARRRPLVAALTGSVLLLAVAAAVGAVLFTRDLQHAREVAEANLYDTDLNLAQQAWQAGNLGRALSLLEQHVPAPGQVDRRGAEWYLLRALCQSDADTILFQGTNALTQLALAPQGDRVAVSGERELMVLPVAGGPPLGTWPLRPQAEPRGLTFAPDGRSVAVADDAGLELFDLTSGARRTITTSKLNQVAYGPLGKQIAACELTDIDMDPFEAVRLWGSDGRLNPHEAPQCAGSALSWRPDERSLRIVRRFGDIVEWWIDEVRHEVHLAGNTNGARVFSSAFSADGKFVALARWRGPLQVFALEQSAPVFELAGSQPRLVRMAFAPAGDRLAVAAADRRIRVYDLASRAELTVRQGHADEITGISFLPDGQRLITASRDGTVRRWSASTTPVTIEVPHKLDAPQFRAVFSADSRRVALPVTDAPDRRTAVWDLEERRVIVHLAGWPIAFAPEGTRCLSWETEERCVWRDVGGGVETARITLTPPADYFPPELTADGQALVGLDSTQAPAAWDAASGHLLRRAPTPAIYFATAPQGDWVACGDLQGVRLWNRRTGAERPLLRVGSETLAWSHDACWLAVGGRDQRVWLVRVNGSNAPASFAGHQGDVMALRYSADERTLLSGADDRTLRLWNATTRREVAVYSMPRVIDHIAVSPDGRWLLTADLASTVTNAAHVDGTFRLWPMPR